MFHAKGPRRYLALAGLALLLIVAMAGCIPGNMATQARYKPYDPSTFFGDGASMRPLVANTVDRDNPRTGALNTGLGANGVPVASNPLTVTQELITRGQERFEIFCTPCHGAQGEGNGPVVEKGYAKPPAIRSDQVTGLSDGQLFDVISKGVRQMPPYNVQIPALDRWAIVAYLRQLQGR